MGLTGTTTLGQSGHRSKGNEEVTPYLALKLTLSHNLLMKGVLLGLFMGYSMPKSSL